MLALTLFFAAGIVLGVLGLRLLSRWETKSDKRPTIFRHHSLARHSPTFCIDNDAVWARPGGVVTC